MKRRDFITLLGGATIALPRAARAQQPTIPRPLRVGMVHPVSPKGVPPSYVAFFSRLRELGYVEGDTLAIEYINLEGHLERYDEAMRNLVGRRVDLIFALGQEDNLRAAMAATRTVPIVMLAIGYDPLARGYVSSLARPTGNVTGIYVLSIEAIKKRLQLFKDAFPQQHAAFGFWDFDAAEAWRAAVNSAPSLGIALAGVELRDPPYDYERGLQQVAPEFRGALSCPPQPVLLATPPASARSPRATGSFRPSTRHRDTWMRADSCRTAPTSRRRHGGRPSSLTRSRAAPNLLTCLSSNRPGSRCGSTSRPPGSRRYLSAHLPRHRRRGDRMTRRSLRCVCCLWSFTGPQRIY